MRNSIIILLYFIFASIQMQAQDKTLLLIPDRVFDGFEMHENWVVIVKNEQILYAGPKTRQPKIQINERIELNGKTILPGFIEGHSHILLHPYNETNWNDQVLKETEAERVIRATNHLRASLYAGFTTMRDLGSEGAGYADVALRDAIKKGIIVGPDLLVAGKAIVATGSYGPKGFHEDVHFPLGAEEADGYDSILKVVRSQIGHSIDVVKVYADYRWGKNNTAAPTFSMTELTLMKETAQSSGRDLVAHASTEEGMRRAILAGVKTIEHGDDGTLEIFKLMKENGVGLCPTIAAGESISRYNGWKKGVDAEPSRITQKKQSIKLALEAGVEIVFGGDVGVFPHGENALEMELMVEYGMKPIDVLRSATSVNARVFHLDDRGIIKEGFRADIVVIEGNPLKDITTTKKVALVLKNGKVVFTAKK